MESIFYGVPSVFKLKNADIASSSAGQLYGLGVWDVGRDEV
jgi:hypothetical protein